METVGDCIAGGKFTPGGEDGLRAGVNGATTEEEECVDAGNLFEIQNGGLDEGSRTAHSHRIRMGNGPVIARGGGKSNAEDASNGIGVGDRHAEGTSWEGEVGSGQESGNSGFGSRLAEAEIAETSDRVASGSEMEAGKRGAGANGCEEKKGVSETEDCGEKALPVGRRKSKRQQRKAAKPTGKTITVGEFDILFLQDSAHASRQESGKLSPGCLQEVILSNERSPEGFPGPLRDNGASAGVVGVEHWELSVKFLLYVGPESKLFEIGGAPGSSRLVETKSGQLSCGAETPGVGAVNSAKADGIRQGLARGGDDGGNRSGERHEAAGDDVSRESGDVSNGADVNRDGADVRRDGARSEEEDLLYYFVGPHAGERLSDRRDRIAKQLRLSDGSEAKLVLADLFLGASEADGRASENGGAVVTNGQASETNGGASELNAGAANSSGGASGANGGASEANGRAYDIGSWAFRADGEASGSAGGAPQINSEVFRSNSGPTASGFASRASGRVPELNDWTSETDGSLLSEVETSAIKSSIGELCEDPSVRAEEGLRKGGHSRPSSTSADGPCSEAVSRTREAGIDSETKAEASRRSSTTVAVTPRAFVKGYLFYEHALWKRLVGRGSPDSHLELRDVVEETVDDSKPSDRPISDCAEFIRARSEAVEGAESLALASSEAAGEVSIEGDSIGSEGATSAPASVVVESMDDTSASVAVGGGNESEAVPVTGGRNPGTRYEVAERAALNPGHWVGWWTRDVRKFLGDPSFRESRWYIIPKMEWLSPVVIRPPAEVSSLLSLYQALTLLNPINIS